MKTGRGFSSSVGIAIGAALVLILPLLGNAAPPMRAEPSSIATPEGAASVPGNELGGLRLRLDGVATEPVISVASNPAARAGVDRAYGRLPLSFEVNKGQADGQVKFLSHDRAPMLFLTATEAVMVFGQRDGRETPDTSRSSGADLARRPKITRTVVRMELVGANREPEVAGLEELPGRVNYFVGNDPAKWRTDVPTYAKVQYRNVYAGIDLIYHGSQQRLEYDFVVHPGGDPRRILLGFQGVDKLELDGEGNLVLHMAAGAIRQRKPVIYQEVEGARREVSGGYVVKGTHQIGIQVAAYDASRPLIIDPVLSYSTYLGGAGGDQGFSIAVDATGNAYVAGLTASGFPTTAGVFQGTFRGSQNVFVTKLDASGTFLQYSTYLGGSGHDQGYGIAVDAAGNAYVTGFAGSSDFPTTPGVFQPTLASPPGSLNGDAFVTKLNATGTLLLYSTYLGGSNSDYGNGIAVDAAGDAYVTGYTKSSDFPTTPGAFQTTFPSICAFVTKLNATGTALVYSTYLGGTSPGAGNTGNGIAVDAGGNAYVTGRTDALDYPTTAGAFQPALGGPHGSAANAVVTKLNAAGTALVYSTYLGGSSHDQGYGIAVDAAGNAYVTGATTSSDFPTTPGAFQPTYANFPGSGLEDAFVTKLNATGAALVYSTYLGGGSGERGLGIAADAAGNASVTGFTNSADFPTTAAAFQKAFSGGLADAFVATLNPAGSALVSSTYLGGRGDDYGAGIAVDANGNAHVTGDTSSADFPTTTGTFQGALAVQSNAPVLFNAFVAKISVNTPAGANVSVSAGNGVTVTFPLVTSPGETAAPTSSTGPTPPGGFSLGTPPTYYNIQTTATYVSTVTATVSVCITYNPAQFVDPSTLHLLHFQNNAWVDVTTSIDTTNHVICGSVNSLSPFAIFQKLPPADMAIGKSGPSTVSSGSNLTYNIGVVDLGPNTASGVVVTDHVPAGTTFVSAQFAKGSCTVSGGTVSCTISQPGTPCAFSNGTVTCNVGTLPPYTSANPAGAGVQLVVQVTAPRGATITNTATVSASNPDPNQANNSSTATTSVR